MMTPFGRFTYFFFREINPQLDYLNTLPIPWPKEAESQVAHSELSDIYQGEYEDGKADAIFDYVQADCLAFRSPWVLDQIEMWRLQDTDDSRAKLRKLMKAYSLAQGRTSHENLLYIVQRDQAIFKAVVLLKMQGFSLKPSKKQLGCYARVANQFSMVSPSSVETVYKKYLQAIFSEVTGGWRTHEGRRSTNS